MTENPPVTAPPPAAPRGKKRLVIVLALLVVTAVPGWYGLRRSVFWQDVQYHRLLKRIEARLEAMSFPKGNPPDLWPKSDRGRYEIFRSIHNALYNYPFWYKRGTVPEKVEAIADRLDATNGVDLQTFDGCVRILVMCDEASWTFYDYDIVRGMYEMADDGAIPKLPELGKRWQNDERRKEFEKWTNR